MQLTGKAYAHNFGHCSIVALYHGWENVLQLGLIIVDGDHRGIDCRDDGRDDGRHAVQIMNATGVVYPQAAGYPGLKYICRDSISEDIHILNT